MTSALPIISLRMEPALLGPVFNSARLALPYTAYIEMVTRLLTRQMPGTALVVCNGHGRIALDPSVGIVTYEAGQSLDDAYDLDSSAWDDEMGAWEGDTHAQTWRDLESPTFDYTHSEARDYDREAIREALGL
jgi:hypothetical protein